MWLLIVSPIMDNINGYLLLTGKDSSISIIFKTIIFLLCLIISVKITTTKQIMKIVFTILVFVLQLAMFEINNEGGLSYNISAIIKLLIPIVISMAVHTLAVYDGTMKTCIDKVLNFYCWFFPLSVIIPELLNVGFSTYASGAGTGSKGFYYAGNEIGIILIIMLMLEIDKYKNSRTKINLLNILLGVISILYLGTKSVYISLVIFILVALYSEQNINKKVLNTILIVPSIIVGLWYVITNVDLVTQNINIIIWRYTSMSTGMINFLLSGREMKLMRLFDVVYNENILGKILFGIGPYTAEYEVEILVEMDLFDLIIRFGLIVSIIMVLFYAKYIKYIKDAKNILYIIGIILVYGASLVSGHMIFAPMVSIVLVMLLLKVEFKAEMKNSM